MAVLKIGKIMTENQTNDLSKFIALILRHKPQTIGIQLNKNGWANVDELIKGISKHKKKPFSMEMLEQIVVEDEKKRYSFNDNKTLIRANQGHSISVDVELKECRPPEILYHGTSEKFVSSIDHEGLLPKSRLYVHLSKDIETAKSVGSRHGNPIIYKVKSLAMHNVGYKFYLSTNGVWLVQKVPVEYLEK